MVNDVPMVQTGFMANIGRPMECLGIDVYVDFSRAKLDQGTFEELCVTHLAKVQSFRDRASA